jgi:hypothetical protein
MPDILWSGPDYQVGVWLMNGATPTAQAVVGIPVGWQIINTGDYNGDGKSDIAFQNVQTGNVSIWCMSGTQTIPCGSSAPFYQPQAGWYLQGPRPIGPAGEL